MNELNLRLMERVKNFVNEELSSYPENIKYLLKLIIPSFVIKYGYNEERTILNVFRNVPLEIIENPQSNSTAYFSRILYKDGKQYKSKKRIVLEHYKTSDLSSLIDSVIHEYNHAVNSWKNEIKEDEDKLYMRTGIAYIVYDKNDFKKEMDNENITLEEIINTRQSELLIEIMLNLSKNLGEEHEYNSALNYLSSHFEDNYRSEAYLLQTTISKKIINNRSFFSSLETLRFSGYVDEFPKFFDDVTAKEGSFNKFSKTLDEIIKKEAELSKYKFFKNYHYRKLKALINQVIEIIDLFDQNAIYK